MAIRSAKSDARELPVQGECFVVAVHPAGQQFEASALGGLAGEGAVFVSAVPESAVLHVLPETSKKTLGCSGT